jgi:thiol-disulfide isomerase/thioredoxin
MRQLLAAAALAALVSAAPADDKPAKSKKESASLKVGDPAPALKADKWLQGSEVKAFDPGKVYVVEFWATWCGPCIVMMPHLAELQREYKDKGVTVVGFTAKDPSNSAEKVAKFVGKRGPKLGYTFAYADGRQTYEAWMDAAKQNGIPCSFVIDPKGKVAYIGHPMYLDEVLPKVVDGSWNAEEDAAALKKTEKEVNNVFQALNKSDPEAGLKALADFEGRHPAMGKIPYFVAPRIQLLLKAKKTDEAVKAAQEALARASEQGDTMGLGSLTRALSSKEAKDAGKEVTGLALRAAGAMLEASGEDDPIALLTAAEAHFAAGDKAKAREYGRKASGAAAGESAGLANQIRQRAKKYEADDGEPKKPG